MPKAQFWTDLSDLKRERDNARFWRDVDFLIDDTRRVKERQERYWAMRREKQRKAIHLQSYIKRVECFDPWREMYRIDPEFYYEEGDYEREVKRRVKILMNKQLRILWILRTMHTYLVSNQAPVGSKKTAKYSIVRKCWGVILKTHKEKLRQARWDAKRARVRSRRKNKNLREQGIDPILEEKKRGEVVALMSLRELQCDLNGHAGVDPIQSVVSVQWEND